VPDGVSWLAFVMKLLGAAGAVLFYGRFYVQWITSELRRRSVMPIAFWYMSAAGSVLLLVFGFYIRSPIATLSQTFNMSVYARNLVHVWRERGVLTPWRYRLTHALALGVLAVAVGFTLYTWWAEYEHTRTLPQDEARETWLWIAVGAAAQALFAVRFILQWAVTEAKRKSTIPTSFWYLSIVAASLLALAHAQRHEWLYAVGLLATVGIYARNLWFIYRVTPAESAQSSG
jgi:lipid-A-disaccharide synthase-like uncharacterized protein